MMCASAEAAALRTGAEAREPDLDSSRSFSRPRAATKDCLKPSSPLEARLPSMVADRACTTAHQVSSHLPAILQRAVA